MDSFQPAKSPVNGVVLFDIAMQHLSGKNICATDVDFLRNTDAIAEFRFTLKAAGWKHDESYIRQVMRIMYHKVKAHQFIVELESCN